jgi:phosphatidylserine/phosphatidylglycerophosphate/cardiolipin synthase-like enzyme
MLEKTKENSHQIGSKFLFQSKRAGVESDLRSNLVDFINKTKSSLYCAIYDLRDEGVLKALKNLNNNTNGKIKLHIAYDAGKQRSLDTNGVIADPKPAGTEEYLKKFGLEKVSTAVHAGSHIMHDKFLIRDGLSVWTGSANFTMGGLDLQDNNCIIVDSQDLAKAYQNTFNELLNPNHKHPRPKEEHNTPSPVSNKPIKVGKLSLIPYFSPASGEGIEDEIVSLLNKAKRVRVLSMIISDEGILQALADLGRGNSSFDIRGIYDLDQMKQIQKESTKDPSLFWFMNDKRFVGAPSHPFSPKHENDFMHNKVLIMDDNTVVTGSYNLSENAESNDENLLVIKSHEVAREYESYFDTLYRVYNKKITTSM